MHFVLHTFERNMSLGHQRLWDSNLGQLLRYHSFFSCGGRKEI